MAQRFNVGDIVIYGTQGICTVDAIGPLPMSVANQHERYYTLHPYYRREMVIYAPVDNESIVMRVPIAREEAERLIREIPGIEGAWIPNEKEREAQYRQALHTCDCRELVSIIKALYRRRAERVRRGKRSTAVDERYFRMAEEQLYSELAYALGMERDAIPAYIQESIAPATAQS